LELDFSSFSASRAVVLQDYGFFAERGELPYNTGAGTISGVKYRLEARFAAEASFAARERTKIFTYYIHTQ
jgi:hypothetical protein